MNSVSVTQNRPKTVFFVFCLWTFILLSRPQDIFPALDPFRPALTTGILTMVLVFLHMGELRGSAFFLERQVKYYTALLVVMIIGIPFSLYVRMSFMTIFTGYVNVVLFFFIFYKLVDSVDRLYKVLLIGCLGNGLYMAFSLTKGALGSGRLSFGDMFDPNDLAYFALSFLPLNLIFISRDNRFWMRLLCVASFGVGGVVILLTGSRGGLLAFGVTMVILLLFSTRTINFALKATIVVLGLIAVCNMSINTKRYETLLTIQNDYNVEDETGRFAIWEIGLRSMMSNPLTGVGVGCYGNAVGLDRERRGADTVRWQTAHNSFVLIGTETGILGLILYTLLSWNVIKIFYRAKKSAKSELLVKISEMGFAGFAGLTVASMFLSQAYSMYWAFYVVFSAVASQLLAREQTYAEERS